MPNFLIKVLLCLSSYFPLAAIFFIQFIFKGQTVPAVASLSIGLVGLIGLSAYLRFAARLHPVPVGIQSVTRKDGEAMSYIVTYLLPFVALPNSDYSSILSLSVFLVVVCTLYVNSDMLHINPMLNFAGWHLYEVALDTGDVRTLISKDRIRKGHASFVVHMGQDILIEVKKCPQKPS